MMYHNELGSFLELDATYKKSINSYKDITAANATANAALKSQVDFFINTHHKTIMTIQFSIQ